MSSIRPHRTHWISDGIGWAWWAEDTSLSDLEHNSDQLIAASYWSGSYPALAERYRFAIKFDAYSPPSWASLGPITSKGMALFIALKNKGIINASDRFQCASITSSWDDTTNLAGMRSLTVGTWYDADLIWALNGQAVGIYFDTQLMSANGLMFRPKYWPVTTFFTHMANTFSTKTPPQMRYYYQYTPSKTIRSDATTRPTLDDATIRILNDQESPRKFSTSITVLASERNPNQSDTELSTLEGLPSLLQRKAPWPESWQGGTPAAGGLPTSLVEDSIENIRGHSVKTTLTVIKKTGESVELAKQIQVAGDTKWKNDGQGEIELRSPSEAITGADLIRVDPLVDLSISYDTEDPIYIMLDVMMNCGAWIYPRWHFNDVVYLQRRFEGVFSGISLTSSDMDGKKVSDVLKWMGAMLGLMVTQSADGCMSIIHPGVYRESIRVHDIDQDDCLPNGCVVTDRGRDGMYGGVEVTSPLAETNKVYQNEHIPTDDGWLGNLYSFTAYGDIFDVAYTGGNDFPIARLAAGTQISQRMAGRYLMASLLLEKKGMIIDPGDVVNLTCNKYEGTKKFFVIQGNTSPDSGLSPAIGIHYPDYPGLTSTWQDDGVKGIWRWTNPVSLGGSPAAYEFDPQDHTATDGPWTTDTAHGYPFSEVLAAHYQGKCQGDFLAWNGPLISDTTDLCDLIDICTIVHGDFPYFTSNNHPASWTVDDEDKYIPIMWWRKASGTESIMLAIDRSTKTSLSDYSLNLNRLFVGYTTAIGAGPTVWSARVNAPYGSLGGGQLRIAGSSDIEEAIRAASIGVAWKDTTIRLYIDGVLVGELTDSNFDKASWTDLYIRGCDGAPGGSVSNITQCMIGCVRHIQTIGWIETERIQGTNGIDPYYP